MDLQIAGQGDTLGHQDTIEMVMALLFCLKFQNDFPPNEVFFFLFFYFSGIYSFTLVVPKDYKSQLRRQFQARRGFFFFSAFLCYCFTHEQKEKHGLRQREEENVCMCEETCDIDAGNSVWCQDEVFFTEADDAVLGIVAFTALTVAAVLHRTYDHLAIPVNG